MSFDVVNAALFTHFWLCLLALIPGPDTFTNLTAASRDAKRVKKIFSTLTSNLTSRRDSTLFAPVHAGDLDREQKIFYLVGD